MFPYIDDVVFDVMVVIVISRSSKKKIVIA